MKNKVREIRSAISGYLLFIFLLIFMTPLASQGAELVSCRYLESSGNKILLEMSIGTPPPASLIIIQNIPTGVDIISSSPQIKKFNKKQGEAKWLLKDVGAGNMTLTLTLSSPIGPGQISGEIRYKNPVNGSMIQMPIRP